MLNLLRLVALSVVLCCGCSQDDMLEKFSSPEDRLATAQYLKLLRAGDFATIEKALDPSIKSPAMRSTLEEMRRLMPDREPVAVKLVGSQTSHEPGVTIVNTTFEYDYGDQWLLANVAIRKEGTKRSIVGFRVTPNTQSLASAQRFTLAGKGVVQYLVLGTAITAALLSFYALLACIRAKLPGRKWPWILFIVCGIGRITVNWTTGEWSFVPLSVQLFSASAFANVYGPWMISASLPIGAVLFLSRRKAMVAEATLRASAPKNNGDSAESASA